MIYTTIIHTYRTNVTIYLKNLQNRVNIVLHLLNTLIESRGLRKYFLNYSAEVVFFYFSLL